MFVSSPFINILPEFVPLTFLTLDDSTTMQYFDVAGTDISKSATPAMPLPFKIVAFFAADAAFSRMISSLSSEMPLKSSSAPAEVSTAAVAGIADALFLFNFVTVIFVAALSSLFKFFYKEG